MKNKIAQLAVGSFLLILGAFVVSLSSCNVLADTSGLNLTPETVWLRLVPSVAVEGEATLVLDFSKPLAGLTKDTSATDLAAIFAFGNGEGMSGAEAITPISITQDSTAVYRLTVEHVPDVEKGIVLVTIQKPTGIAPATRAWSLDGVVTEAQFLASPSIALTPGHSQLGYTITASAPAAERYDIYWIAGIQTVVETVKGGTKIGDGTSLTGTISGLADDTIYSVIVTAHKAGYVDADSTIAEGMPTLYAIGATGPAGGWIFYDKGEYSEGWRYLEAASEDLAGTYAWASSAYSYIEISGTAPDIGSGTVNTTTILTIDANAPAAKACADYAYGGYEDWFLPSKNELNLMWTNLKEQGRGDFIDNEYWSSSDGAYVYRPWNQNFSNGNPDYNIKYVTLLVRAARSF